MQITVHLLNFVGTALTVVYECSNEINTNDKEIARHNLKGYKIYYLEVLALNDTLLETT